MFVMVFVPGEPFYPSLLFADKAGENQSRTPSGCSTPGACIIKLITAVIYGFRNKI